MLDHNQEGKIVIASNPECLMGIYNPIILEEKLQTQYQQYQSCLRQMDRIDSKYKYIQSLYRAVQADGMNKQMLAFMEILEDKLEVSPEQPSDNAEITLVPDDGNEYDEIFKQATESLKSISTDVLAWIKKQLRALQRMFRNIWDTIKEIVRHYEIKYVQIRQQLTSATIDDEKLKTDLRSLVSYKDWVRSHISTATIEDGVSKILNGSSIESVALPNIGALVKKQTLDTAGWNKFALINSTHRYMTMQLRYLSRDIPQLISTVDKRIESEYAEADALAKNPNADPAVQQDIQDHIKQLRKCFTYLRDSEEYFRRSIRYWFQAANGVLACSKTTTTKA